MVGKNRKSGWIILALSFGVAIATVIVIARNRDLVAGVIRRLGIFGPVASLMLYALLGMSPIPADSLTLINGAVFGPLWGGLLAWVGTTLAAVVEYFMGTRIADAAEFERRKSELPWGLNDLPVESVWFLIGGRMLTGAGSKIVSFTSGMYHVPLLRYLWTTALTMLFGAVLFALGGFGLLNIV
jgi:uncharacterized membrane protein YdjX (TVP38/TMEM64 family)